MGRRDKIVFFPKNHFSKILFFFNFFLFFSKSFQQFFFLFSQFFLKKSLKMKQATYNSFMTVKNAKNTDTLISFSTHNV